MKDERRRTKDEQAAEIPATRPGVEDTSCLVYVAYPSSLTLRSANAVQTYSTARELRALDPAVAVLIPRWARRESVFTEVGANHLLRLPFNVLSHLWRTTAWSYLERSWFAWRATAWLLRRRGDAARPVIYARDAVGAAWFGAGLAWLAGARLIYECHDLEAWNPSRMKARAATPLVRLIDSCAIRRADRVVALTGTFRDWLDHAGLKRREAVAVIPDAYDDARWQPRARAAARVALGLPGSAFVVTYSGLTFAYRGLDHLVRAFARFRETAPDSVLLLVGGRERERTELAALAGELGIADAVRCPGQRPQDEVVDYLAAADALVMQGTVSGLNASPLKLFEYAAMGRPIVAGDIPAVREVLGDDGAAYFPQGDEAALRAALVTLQRDPAAADAMAARARARVQPFTYRARAAAILALARSLDEPGHRASFSPLTSSGEGVPPAGDGGEV